MSTVETIMEPSQENREAPPAAPRSLDGRLPALDGLRGVAVLIVLLCHFYQFGDLYHVMQSAVPLIGKIVGRVATEGAGLGVDLFFVLSGFLITGILLDAKGTGHYFRNFYMRRFLRIFPLYYGTLFVVLVVAPLLLGPGSHRCQTLMHNQAWLWLYGVNLPGGVSLRWSCEHFQLTHFWSLAVEEHFYLVWPLLVSVCSRRALLCLCGLLIAGALIFRSVLVIGGVSGWFLTAFTLCRVDGLAMGAVLATILRSDRAEHDALVHWAKRVAPLASLLVIATLFRPRSVNWIGPVFGLTASIFLFAGVLVQAVARSWDGTRQRILENPLLRAFGKYSYALYVLHFLLQPSYRHLFPIDTFAEQVHSIVLRAILQLLVLLVGSFLIAWLSWHLYEKHFLTLKRFFECRGSTCAPTRSVSTNHTPEVVRGE